MKILVTGAKGQLGNELNHILEQNLPGITTYTSWEALNLADSESLQSFLQRGMFTHVVNAASYNAIDKAEEENRLCASINTDAVSNLANYADEYGYKIIHLSTAYVFDGTSNRPYTESDKVNPISQYGSSKRKGETSLLALAPESIIIRTGWTFSPYGDSFVKKVLELSATESQLNIVWDQIGSPTYTRDLAKAIYTILTAQQWVPGFFNFSNEGVASRYDIAKAIMRIAHIDHCKINPIAASDFPSIASRPYYSVLDKSRIKATYGIEMPHWEEALADCLNRLGH